MTPLRTPTPGSIAPPAPPAPPAPLAPSAPKPPVATGGIAIGYTRVSSEQQAGEKQTSLADQRVAIEQLAARLGVQIVEWYEDAGFSGKTIAKRPAMRALLQHCAETPQTSGPQAYVLALNDSRFGRFPDPDEAAALRFRLRESGWMVRFAEADDVQDPSLRHIMRAVGGAQASEYLRNLSANCKRGRDGTIRQGFWPGRAPFGFRRAVVYPTTSARVLEDGQAKARGEKIRLVHGPADEVALVRDIFDKFVTQGWSMRRISAWLRTTRPAAGGTREWYMGAMRALLDNAAYVGAVPSTRRPTENTARGDWRRYPASYIQWDAHEPIIARATWDRAQEILAGVQPRGATFDYRVRGVVACARCGALMVGGGVGGVRASTRARGHFYVDRGARPYDTDGAAICPKPATTIYAHLLEGAVIDAMAEHLEAQLTDDVIREAMATRLAAPARTNDRKVRLAEIERRIGRLTQAVELGTLEHDDVAERLNKLRDERATLSRSVDPAEDARNAKATVEQLTAIARDFRALAQHASGGELRTLLHPWVEQATFDGRTRELTLTLRTLQTVLVPSTVRPHAPIAGSLGGHHAGRLLSNPPVVAAIR